MGEKVVRRRLGNIVRRMLAGDEFYFSDGSPRITRAEVRELEALGLRVQVGLPYGESHYACIPSHGTFHNEDLDAMLQAIELCREFGIALPSDCPGCLRPGVSHRCKSPRGGSADG